MKSEPLSVKGIFQDRRQYHVPFYQRAYVWNREDQWERLWGDIQEKAEERLTGSPGNPHFLGAAVLEPQPHKGLIGVPSLHIIDGQQRLTTLQYVLAALSIVLRKREQDALLSVVEGCRWNPNPETMQKPKIERFKLWPTFRDRHSYARMMDAESEDDIRQSFPENFTQAQRLRRIGMDHPAALEATWYFLRAISAWAEADGEDGTVPRLTAISEAVLQDLSIVMISLDEGDDAQIIFETLNGHGAQLLATDLIRNYIFMRADKDGVDGGNLYNDLWSQFEGPYWSEEQRRGRLKRPRMEWFMQSLLQAELRDEVDPGRLYPSYKKFVSSSTPPLPADRQLAKLDSYAVNYRRIQRGEMDTAVGRFGAKIDPWDVSAAVSLGLALAESGTDDEDQAKAFSAIVSYVVRRAICGLTNKSYNKIFIQLIKSGELTSSGVIQYFSSLEGESSRWPTDKEFRRAWLDDPMYPGRLDAAKMRAVLYELESHMRTSRSEDPYRPDSITLDIEHVLPQSWAAHWPLPDGHKVSEREIEGADLFVLLNENPSVEQEAIVKRERAKRQMGNLTLLHYGANRSMQNRDFETKRKVFFRDSNLHLNRMFMVADSWGEEAIRSRGAKLFEAAVEIWVPPSGE